jgi:hypothetical protein
MLQLIDAPQAPIEIRKNPITSCEYPPPITSVWNFFFDGVSSKENVGVGVVFISPSQEAISYLTNSNLKQKTMWQNMRLLFWALGLPKT